MELLADFHKDAERQGPGSSYETIKALSFTNFNKNHQLKITDIGCGPGGQIITLAQNIEGQIIAVDLFPEFFYRVWRSLKKKLKNDT